MDIIDFFYEQVEENKEEIKSIVDTSGIDSALKSGKKAALLSIEGGHVLEGSISVLRLFYRLGVRCVTLTWNGRNEVADGVAERGTGGGLTEFGKKVVREMNRLGMLIDVSHLSEAGIRDVLSISEAPVIASHSNCYSICNHPRNLTDEQIVAIARKEGLIGINFYPEFLGKGEISLDTVIEHIEHVTSLVGVDYLGLGSDFDGIDKTPAGLEDVGKLPKLTERLLKRSYKEEDIRKILGKNFLRVLKRVLG
jgi:membrane dipeptidase